MKDMRNDFIIVVEGFVDLKDKLYKFCDQPKNYLGLTTHKIHIDGHSRLWHE